MLVIIIILAVGVLVAFTMILAASILSSHISSMEGEYMVNEPIVKHSDQDSPAGIVSP